MSVVKVSYFSDVLCIWAYIAQARIDAVKEKFGDAVELERELESRTLVRRHQPVPLAQSRQAGRLA